MTGETLEMNGPDDGMSGGFPGAAEPSTAAGPAFGQSAVYSSARGARGLDFLMDVSLSLSVEVGRVQMPLRQVMDLAPGSVVELQHSASEPVEIHANGRCIGRGEIVVVGEQFGIRVTELGSVS